MMLTYPDFPELRHERRRIAVADMRIHPILKKVSNPPSDQVLEELVRPMTGPNPQISPPIEVVAGFPFFPKSPYVLLICPEYYEAALRCGRAELEVNVLEGFREVKKVIPEAYVLRSLLGRCTLTKMEQVKLIFDTKNSYPFYLQ
jgi:hypothetical protein